MRVAMRYRRRSITRNLALIGLATGLGVSLGCGSDATGPSRTANAGYYALQLNHRAITLSLTAPSNQIQLHAVPITMQGDTLSTPNTVQYTSNDSSVIVDSTGLLTARLTSAGVRVVATLTVSNERGQSLTLADTALVNVNAPPAPIPVVTALQIMTPGDSATFSAVYGMDGFTATALDASHTPLNDAYEVFCRSSDRNVVDFGQGIVYPFQEVNQVMANQIYVPGTTTLTCSTTIYGVNLVDSIPIRIGMPLYSKITVDTVKVLSGTAPVVVSTAVVKIGVGGIIQWDNRSKQQVDLVFDDSLVPQSVSASESTYGSGILTFPCFVATNCALPSAAGNVLLPVAARSFANGVGRDFRRFSAAGTYPYHSTRYPTLTGTIVVVNN